MSSNFPVRAILDDPTLMWDERCMGDFTLSGRKIHYPGPGFPRKIEKLDEKIIKLYQACGISTKEYSSILTKLQELYENRSVSIKDRAEYLGKIRSLLSQLPQARKAAQMNMAALASQLTEEKRKKILQTT